LIDEAQPGYATVSMRNRALVQNAKGGVMGGALYTLADFAASIADYEAGYMNMSIDSHMQFVHVAKGKRLVATAIAEYRGRTMGYIRIRVEDDLGTLVATSSFTSMHVPLHDA
ncbi:MAG: PaaI family thioesterase, partial [Eggerthellaceae bacterium]|nr:PaaI family thioesterase [Eggerthellaceae bacterium]